MGPRSAFQRIRTPFSWLPCSYFAVNRMCRSMQSDARGLDLLPGVIARAHERTRFHVAEAHRHSLLAEHPELIRRQVPIQLDVGRGGTQVLAKGDDVHVQGREVT